MNKPQIFCFTFAGGTSSFFDEIEKDLPEFELVKLEYSGHGIRHREPLYESFSELTEDMLAIISQAQNGEDFALFGYSMGSISVLEVLKQMPERNKPSQIFLAAHEPLLGIDIEGMGGQRLEEWVKARTINFGAVPEKLVNNKVFWRTYLPIYAADYAMIGMYRFEDLEFQTDIPTSIFYSESDTAFDNMKLWRKYFIGRCDFYRYEGSHFFIREHHHEMAEAIQNAMRREKVI